MAAIVVVVVVEVMVVMLSQSAWNSGAQSASLKQLTGGWSTPGIGSMTALPSNIGRMPSTSSSSLSSKRLARGPIIANTNTPIAAAPIVTKPMFSTW